MMPEKKRIFILVKTYPTTKQFHNIAPNPFIIVGVFYPPMPSENQQTSLFNQ
jgi:hypothetical protein